MEELDKNQKLIDEISFRKSNSKYYTKIEEFEKTQLKRNYRFKKSF